jgi:hypothetical protein
MRTMDRQVNLSRIMAQIQKKKGPMPIESEQALILFMPDLTTAVKRQSHRSYINLPIEAECNRLHKILHYPPRFHWLQNQCGM